jgi:hypothetical protein
MDITALTHAVTTSLIPVLPYLLKAGEKAAEEAGKKLGGNAWEEVKKLWTKLGPKFEAKPAALEAVHEVASAPDDADAQAALRLQLRKLLTEDQNLARKINQWWENAKQAGVDVAAIGNRSVAVAGDVKESTVITGDRNVVQ